MDTRLIPGDTYRFEQQIELGYLGSREGKAYFLLKDRGFLRDPYFAIANEDNVQRIGNEIKQIRGKNLSLDVGNLAYFKSIDRANIIELRYNLKSRLVSK